MKIGIKELKKFLEEKDGMLEIKTKYSFDISDKWEEYKDMNPDDDWEDFEEFHRTNTSVDNITNGDNFSFDEEYTLRYYVYGGDGDWIVTRFVNLHKLNYESKKALIKG